jgi:hypothetical protein
MDSSEAKHLFNETKSRMRFWASTSTIGRSSANDRRSPLTLYCLAGKVTFRPAPVRRSQTANPISFMASSGPVGLIRFGGHLPKGEYDVDHGGHEG